MQRSSSFIQNKTHPRHFNTRRRAYSGDARKARFQPSEFARLGATFMTTTLAPEPTYEPELTGLIIVDPYNDFLSEGGKLYELSRATLEKSDVVAHMRQILAAIREEGIQVFIAPHHRWRESDQHMHWKTVPPIGAASFKGRVFADGTWGGSFHPDFRAP